MTGVGTPVALHVMVTVEPSVTVTNSRSIVTLGGTSAHTVQLTRTNTAATVPSDLYRRIFSGAGPGIFVYGGPKYTTYFSHGSTTNNLNQQAKERVGFPLIHGHTNHKPSPIQRYHKKA